MHLNILGTIIAIIYLSTKKTDLKIFFKIYYALELKLIQINENKT